MLAGSRRQIAAHKRIESWRERLLAGPGALDELLAEYPGADTQRLSTLVGGALRERDAGSPPRSYRALYQELRALIVKSVGGE
jgi:ribosome-associated protein